MNRLLILSSLLLILCAIVACNSNVSEEERPALQSYTSEEIGWSIEIPTGYKLTSKDKMNADDQKGKEAIGKVYKGEVKMDSLRHIVSFNKNQFNAFDSTIEPYQEEEDGAYAANKVLVNKLIYDTYHEQGIKIDTSSAKISVKRSTF